MMNTIDESMVPYFGKHGCKQFIKGKPIRYGCKIWMGATSTGYAVWLEPRLEPYQEAKTKIENKYKTFGLEPKYMPTYCITWGSIHFMFSLIIFLRLYHFWTSRTGGILEQPGQYEKIACPNVHLYLSI
jgi:hypothetical protein